MAIQLPFTLGASTSSSSKVPLGKLTAPTKKRLAPVGLAYLDHADRVLAGRTLEEHAAHLTSESDRKRAVNGNGAGEDDEVDDGAGDEPESRQLLELDPRDWKNQDQYAVLGIASLRWRATPDQIKRAHRKKVLRHHPDKKAGQLGNANDDSFFKCIAKAHEILSDPVKRRQFDSIDEGKGAGNLSPPSAAQVSDPEAFFAKYGEIFNYEARFSTKQPVPTLGGADASRDEVEDFYDFWLTFESWRSFEWRDKDANEGSDSRGEKRHIENKNRAERERLKKEDNARRRNVVETALAQDPRVKSFKAADRAAREAKKRPTANNSPAPAPTAAETAAQEQVAAVPEMSKTEREAAKKAKEAARKQLKKDQKAIAATLASNNYLLPAGEAASPARIDEALKEVDRLIDGLEPKDVATARKEAEGAQGGADEVKRVLAGWAKKAEQTDGKGSFAIFA